MTLNTFCDLLILGFYMLLFYGVSVVLSKGQHIARKIVRQTTTEVDDHLVRGLFNGLWFLYWALFCLVMISCVVELFK